MKNTKTPVVKKAKAKTTAKIECKIFGRNLGKILKSKGMSQTDLAKEIDLTRSCVSAIVKGKRDPQLSTIMKIMTVLPVKFEKLAGA